MDELLEKIKNRLVQEKWEYKEHEYGMMGIVGVINHNEIEVCSLTYGDRETIKKRSVFIANAPTDIGLLLGIVKAQEEMIKHLSDMFAKERTQ